MTEHTLAGHSPKTLAVACSLRKLETPVLQGRRTSDLVNGAHWQTEGVLSMSAHAHTHTHTWLVCSHLECAFPAEEGRDTARRGSARGGMPAGDGEALSASVLHGAV